MFSVTRSLPLPALRRVRAILLAIFFASIGHGAMFILLPVTMNGNGLDTSTIGWVMSCYALGMMIGSRSSNRLLQAFGHHRVYAVMAACICIVAVLHSLFTFTWLLVIFRLAVGWCMSIMYITLESWLSATSDRNSRGVIYAVYQVCFGFGFMFAPFVATLLPPEDLRSYGLVAIVMSLSLMPLLISHQQSPIVKGNQSMLPLLEMLRDSPTTTIGALSSGITYGALLTLFTVYLLSFGIDGTKLAIIFASLQVGSLLFQIPVGKFADAWSKRQVMLVLCGITSISWLVLVLLVSFIDTPSLWLITIPVIFFGGAQACMYPLCVSLLFEQVDTDKAVPAMGTLLLLLTVGLTLGPIMASQLMDMFGAHSLAFFTIGICVLLSLFIAYRKLYSKTHVDRESIPYVMSFQNQRSNVYNLDPRMDNPVFAVDNPGLQAIADSIGLMPHRATKIVQGGQAVIDPDPHISIETLVLLKPRCSFEICKAMVLAYPDMRIEFVEYLGDIIALQKHLINKLIFDGLVFHADSETTEHIRQRFDEIIAQGEQQNETIKTESEQTQQG